MSVAPSVASARQPKMRARDVNREPALVAAIDRLGGVVALAKALNVAEATAGVWFDLPARCLPTLIALTGQAATAFRAGQKSAFGQEWTPERIDLLRSLWSQDLTVAEIAQRLGVTKNAICRESASAAAAGSTVADPTFRAGPTTSSAASARRTDRRRGGEPSTRDFRDRSRRRPSRRARSVR